MYKLFSYNPDLAKKITIESLTDPVTNMVNNEENASLLYWLSKSDNGVKVLEILAENNKKLIAGITETHLMRCIIRGISEDKKPGLCPFGGLLQAKDGTGFCKTISNYNQNFDWMKMLLNYDDLMSKHNVLFSSQSSSSATNNGGNINRPVPRSFGSRLM